LEACLLLLSLASLNARRTVFFGRLPQSSAPVVATQQRIVEQQGHRLLRNVEIAAAITARTAKLAMPADEVLERDSFGKIVAVVAGG